MKVNKSFKEIYPFVIIHLKIEKATFILDLGKINERVKDSQWDWSSARSPNHNAALYRNRIEIEQ